MPMSNATIAKVVKCPVCGAQPHKSCTSASKVFAAPHKVRVHIANELLLETFGNK